MGDFTMPSLGADMDEGTVTEWLVKPGDQVRRGDIVAVVDTDKSTIEVEVFETGTIEQILVEEGDKVPVGTVLARISTSAAAAVPPVPVKAPAPTSAEPGAGTTYSPVVRHLADRLGVDLASVTGTGRGGTVTRKDVERAAPRRPVGVPRGNRVRSSPLARRIAAENGLDLTAVTGRGPGGAVRAADILTGTSAGRPSVPDTGSESRGPAGRMDAMRSATGLLMARSKREIPHYYLSTTIDMGAAVSWLERANGERPVTDRLVPAALLLKATARAAAKSPGINGFFSGDGFDAREEVNLGVAISLRGGGLVAPAICNADQLGLDELMSRLRDLVGRARAGRLRSSEATGATITVTNLGDLGVESVFGVIYPPQVALVGFGKLIERPVARNGLIGVGSLIVCTLSADHRASDGHLGGRFLTEIDHLLQEPEKL